MHTLFIVSLSDVAQRNWQQTLASCVQVASRLQSSELSAIYSSDLQRTMQTALIVAEALRLEASSLNSSVRAGCDDD